MPKFFAVAVKDLKVFFRRKSTTALLLLSPIIVIVFLGVLFGGQRAVVGRGLPMVVCNYDEGSDGVVIASEFLSVLSNVSGNAFSYNELSQTFALNQEACRQFAELNVRKGNYAAGLFFPKAFTYNIVNGNGQTLEMYMDNSKLEISTIEQAYVGAVTQLISIEVGSQFVNKVWEKLRRTDDQIGQLQKERIPSARSELEATRSNLSAFNDRLNSFDIQSFYNSVAEGKASLSEASSRLDELSASSQRARSRLNSAQSDLSAARSYASQASSTVSTARSRVSSAKASIGCPSAPAGCTELDQVDSELSAVANQVYQVQSKLDSYDSEITESRRELDQLDASVVVMRQKLSQSDSKLDSVRDTIREFEQFKSDSLALVSQTNSRLAKALSDLDALSQYLDDAHREIREFTSKNPENVVRPILLKNADSFDWKAFRSIDFLIYGIIAIIVMLSSLLLSSVALVKERSSGVFQRVLISPVSSWSFVLGKLVASQVLLLVEVALLFAIAAFVFNVKLWNAALVVSVALLLAACFVCLGLIIGAVSRTENTAILSVIALSIPMIFISGIVFPYEFMPVPVQIITDFSPVTFGIAAMKYSSLYQVTPNFFSVWGPMEYSLAALFAEFAVFFLLAVLALKVLGSKEQG